jgi:DNA replication protein DnaC
VQLLILDDFALRDFTEQQSHDLYEVGLDVA